MALEGSVCHHGEGMVDNLHHDRQESGRERLEVTKSKISPRAYTF
jgi:hypothetical protein